MTGNVPSVFSNDLSRIDAWIADGKTGRDYKASFSPSSVLRVVDLGDDASMLVLVDGARIPVAMPYETLRDKIYTPDFRKEAVLDLLSATGVYIDADIPDFAPVAATTPVFNEAAAKPVDMSPPERALSNEDLTIKVFVRKAQTDSYQMLTVRESQIDLGKTEEEATGRNGPLIKIHLKNGRLDPFGDAVSIIDMTNQRFMEFYTAAKMQGLEELDLLLETKPKLKTPVENLSFKKIALFIRKKNTQNYRLDIAKDEGYIDWANIREIKDINGPAIIIPLKNGVKSEFKEDHLLVDISQAEFMRLYMNAKAQGLREFDLREETGRFIAPPSGANPAVTR